MRDLSRHISKLLVHQREHDRKKGIKAISRKKNLGRKDVYLEEYKRYAVDNFLEPRGSCFFLRTRQREKLHFIKKVLREGVFFKTTLKRNILCSQFTLKVINFSEKASKKYLFSKSYSSYKITGTEEKVLTAFGEVNFWKEGKKYPLKKKGYLKDYNFEKDCIVKICKNYELLSFKTDKEMVDDVRGEFGKNLSFYSLEIPQIVKKKTEPRNFETVVDNLLPELVLKFRGKETSEWFQSVARYKMFISMEYHKHKIGEDLVYGLTPFWDAGCNYNLIWMDLTECSKRTMLYEKYQHPLKNSFNIWGHFYNDPISSKRKYILVRYMHKNKDFMHRYQFQRDDRGCEEACFKPNQNFFWKYVIMPYTKKEISESIYNKVLILVQEAIRSKIIRKCYFFLRNTKKYKENPEIIQAIAFYFGDFINVSEVKLFPEEDIRSFFYPAFDLMADYCQEFYFSLNYKNVPYDYVFNKKPYDEQAKADEVYHSIEWYHFKPVFSFSFTVIQIFFAIRLYAKTFNAYFGFDLPKIELLLCLENLANLGLNKEGSYYEFLALKKWFSITVQSFDMFNFESFLVDFIGNF